MSRGKQVMNGKTELEWEKIHLPSGHKIMPGCKAEVHVPKKRSDRDALWAAIRDFVVRKGIPPFQSLQDLAIHADEILNLTGYDRVYHKWAMVMTHNETCREALTATPFNERLLLLPQCLRKRDVCTATFDAMGLLCNGCGACAIEPFQIEAERLGYATLVSEGTAAVMSVVQAGGVSAFLGVSCLSTLEKVFEFMSMFKVPSIAVPLLQDTCRYSECDADWLRQYMYSRTPGSADIVEEPFVYEPENPEALVEQIRKMKAQPATAASAE
jgi:geranylgeranyl diphosphate synthase, type II